MSAESQLAAATQLVRALLKTPGRVAPGYAVKRADATRVLAGSFILVDLRSGRPASSHYHEEAAWKESWRLLAVRFVDEYGDDALEGLFTPKGTGSG